MKLSLPTQKLFPVRNFFIQAWLILIALAIASPVLAEMRTITATGEYRMGDNDSRTDAKRLALLDAKRLALEKAGTYLESLTEIKNLQVTHDELRAYTAGIVEVTEQATKDVMEGATHIIRVEVTAKIDTKVVARQIDTLRKSETVKGELLRLRAEGDRLRHELEAKSRELAAKKSKTEVERATKERQQFLRRLDAMDDIRSGIAALREALPLRSGYEAASYAVSILKPAIESSKAAGAPESFLSDQRQKLEKAEEAFVGLKEEFLKAMGKARGLAEQAIARAPSEPFAHSLMGTVFLEEGDAIAAVEEFRTALRLHRLEESDVMDAVQAFGTDPRLGEIVAMHQKILAHYHFDLAKALKTSGDLSAAVEEFRKAAGLEPELALFHLELGEALQESGDLKGAVLAYRNAVQRKPNWTAAHWKLAEALERSGDLMGAIGEYREVTRLEPRNDVSAAASLSIATTLARMGNLEEAILTMRSYCQMGPGVQCVLGTNSLSLAVFLAMDFMGREDRAGAIAAARYAVRLEPKTFMSHVMLAAIFDWAGDLSDAIREYRAVLQLKPNDGYAYADLAVLLAEMGDVDGAIREARTALQLEPAAERAHFALGKALLAKGDKEAAAQEFREYLKVITAKLDVKSILQDPKISSETKLAVLEGKFPDVSPEAREALVQEIEQDTDMAVRRHEFNPSFVKKNDMELARIRDAVTTLRKLSR